MARLLWQANMGGCKQSYKSSTRRLCLSNYACSLNFVLSQSVSFMKPVEVFFSSLSDLEAFFFSNRREAEFWSKEDCHQLLLAGGTTKLDCWNRAEPQNWPWKFVRNNNWEWPWLGPRNRVLCSWLLGAFEGHNFNFFLSNVFSHVSTLSLFNIA
jgi:hypothetical protein